MADLITIKGGNGSVPTLQDRELAYSKTEKALYIGTTSGNIRLCGVADAENISTLLTRLEGLQAEIGTFNATLDTINARLDALESSE